VLLSGYPPYLCVIEWISPLSQGTQPSGKTGKTGKMMKKNSLQGKIREFDKKKISGKNQGISPGRPKSMKTLDVNISLYLSELHVPVASVVVWKYDILLTRLVEIPL
jgi:hypothetical protein